MVDPLDEMLKKRAVPKAPSNLAYRIIEASKKTEAQEGSSSPGWLIRGLELFLLPKPALAIAVVVLFGVYVGFAFGEAYVAEDDMFSLYAYQDLEVGDWL